MVLRADEVLEFASRHATYTTSGEREESLRLHLGVLSRPFGWLTKGIWFLCQALLIAWATLAIYYSNLPWAGVRLALAAAFAACAIWALWLSRQRAYVLALHRAVFGRGCMVDIHSSLARSCSGDRKSR